MSKLPSSEIIRLELYLARSDNKESSTEVSFLSRAPMNLASTRFIVSLFLIVATTMQPMSVLAVSTTCSDQVAAARTTSARTTSEGCSCCQVEHQGDEGCCCGYEPTEPASERSDQPITSERTPGSVTPAMATAAMVRHCRCNVATPPMNRSDPREPLVRQVVGRIAALDFVLLRDCVPPRARPLVVNQSSGSRDDFSQRFLCVWRI